MVETCPHIKIDNIKTLQTALANIPNAHHSYKCSTCQSCLYLLFCIHCNYIGCAKNKHARSHYKETGHAFAYNTDKGYLYCYSCEDYIKNYCLKNLINHHSRSTHKKPENTNAPEDSPKHSTQDTEGNDKLQQSLVRSELHHYQGLLLNAGEGSQILYKLSEKVYKKYPCVIIKGFGNLGNTCYLNSLMAVLIYSNEFRDYFLGNKHCIASCWVENCMLCGFKEIYTDLYSKLPGITFHNFIYRLIKKDPYFIGSKQHDVHELFIHLADLIHKEGTSDKCNCLMHGTFFGINSITFICQSCNYTFHREEEYFDLSLQINVNVSSSVKKFFDGEIVGDIKCEQCGTNSSFERKYEIKRLPKLLCLHIKRFEFKNNRITKIMDLIENDSTILLGDKHFYLYGFIVHEGDINNGHYKSYIRIKNKFRCFDDENIKKATSKDIQKNASYLMFYRQMQTLPV